MHYSIGAMNYLFEHKQSIFSQKLHKIAETQLNLRLCQKFFHYLTIRVLSVREKIFILNKEKREQLIDVLNF
jgi:hypothetical protein